MLAYVDKKHTKEQSDASRSSLLLAMALFSEVVDAVRKCTTNLQFASLFLEVGRQVEPSCLVHLFPLPSSSRMKIDDSLNRTSAKSVVDLFSLCVQEGSLMASASALPLLGSRVQSRNYCDLLMARSIEAFVGNTSSTHFRFDRTEEERRVIGDIFRFGIKLEDAAILEDKLKPAEEKKENWELNAERMESSNKAKVKHESDADFSDDDDDKSDSSGSDFSDDSSDEPNALCSIDRNSKMMGVFSMFSEKKEEEEAIRRSALNFIGSNGEVPSLDFLSIAEEKDHENLETSVDEDLKSMGGLVGGALVELLLSPKTDCPWKTMASLARMLLQESFEFGVNIFSKVAARVKGDEVDDMIPDLDPDLRAGDAMDRFTEFLVTETGHCGSQINETDANMIVNLVLFLLQRLETFRLPKSQSFVPAGLVVVGLVAACVSGREQELLATLREDCFVSACYKVTAYDC
jgi:hypothetical protein